MSAIQDAIALVDKHKDVVSYVIQTLEDGKISSDEIKIAIELAIVKAFDEKTKRDMGL